MDSRAHVLLQIDPGRAHEAARFVATLPMVTESVLTTGPYDVIATVAAPSDEALRRTVAHARRTPGLCVLRLCRTGGIGSVAAGRLSAAAGSQRAS